jgi:hypothetical protein
VMRRIGGRAASIEPSAGLLNMTVYLSAGEPAEQALALDGFGDPEDGHAKTRVIERDEAPVAIRFHWPRELRPR